MRDGGDSKLATMTAVAYVNCRGQQCQRMTMALKDNGTQELVVDNNGEWARPGERLRQQETATRDGEDSGLVMMTVAACGDCRGQQCWQMTMTLKENCTQELAADNNGEGMRPGGKQRRHLAFVSGNNC